MDKKLLKVAILPDPPPYVDFEWQMRLCCCALDDEVVDALSEWVLKRFVCGKFFTVDLGAATELERPVEGLEHSSRSSRAQPGSPAKKKAVSRPRR